MDLSIRNPKIDVSKRLLLIMLIVSLIIYLFVPTKGAVSMPFFYIIFATMLISNFVFFKAKRKKNYLDFDTIFIVVYCLVGFTTTFFYHDIDVFRDIFLGFPVDELYINKSNLLFLIGLQSYMIGSLKIPKFQRNTIRNRVIGTNFLIILVFILIIVFFVSGGVSYYRAEYGHSSQSEDLGIVKHVLLLLVAVAMALIGTEMYNKKIEPKYKISKMAFSSMFVLILTLLYAGNRTAASQILLPIVCFYAMFFKNIRFKQFVLLIMLGILSMWFVQRLRTEEQSFELTNPVMLILDLTIPVRNTYAALDYVEKYDYTYGSSMVIGVAAVIPFMPSLVQSVSPDMAEGSAEILTSYTFVINRTPEEVQIGLGTTIIADIYLAFGALGIVLLMFFLGVYVNKWTIRAAALDYHSIILLSGMLGNAIFVVRASYTHPFRFVVWALVLAMFNQVLQKSWRR